MTKTVAGEQRRDGFLHAWFGLKPNPVALLILLIFLLGAAFGVVNHYQNQQLSTLRSAVLGQQKPSTPDRLELNCKVGREGKAPVCSGLVTKAEESFELQIVDLNAQQDMSAWALGMLLISGIGVILSAIGIWFIWETLSATRETLNESKSATKAAEETVKVTKEAARRQLRPYVEVDPGGLTIDENFHVTACIRTRNTGLTPAYFVTKLIKLELLLGAEPVYPPQPVPAGSQFFTLGHGSEKLSFQVITESPRVTEADVRENREGDLLFVVFGAVEYKDDLGEAYSVNYCHFYQKGRFLANEGIVYL